MCFANVELGNNLLFEYSLQLNFFRKGLKSLEAVDPLVRLVTEQQHIDYHFSGLEDDGEDGEEESIYDSKDEGELSFDYRKNMVGVDVSVSRNSMEVSAKMNFSIIFLVIH